MSAVKGEVGFGNVIETFTLVAKPSDQTVAAVPWQFILFKYQ